MALTADQERKRRKEIELLANDWEAHTPTSELRGKTKNDIWWLIDKIWRRKHEVKTLYLWSAEFFARPHMGSYTVPLTHDNLKKPKDVPFMFALTGGWTIPERDLQTLTYGPLLSESGQLLVKEGGWLSIYWKKVWPVIVVVATLGGLVRFIAWLFGGG